MNEKKESGRRAKLARRTVLRLAAAAPLGAAAAGGAEAAPGERSKPAASSRILRLPAGYYQQFDADYAKEAPGEGYGGWKRATLDFDRDRTAVVVMHAWDCGTQSEFPGWYRCVEYIPRANRICRDIFPGLLGAVRRHEMRLFHVVGGGDYYKKLPGYRRAVELAGPSPAPPERIPADESIRRLQQFRSKNVFVGDRNQPDVRRGFARLDFAPNARPLDSEGVAEDSHQLFALCKHHGINHLIYAGFAINWCLLMSPGGMLEMSQRGLLCSAFRQAVTAVENRETARRQLCKEEGLWRVALAFGFVFDVDDFTRAIST